MLSMKNFSRARVALRPVLRETRLVYSGYFSGVTGNKVYLKPENMQVTGSYKIRGAYYKISNMTDQQRERGIITSSAGNHAQGVAYAAKMAKAKATIVMPTTTPLVKINNTKRHGAEVILAGGYYDEAYRYALELAEKEGYEFVHPFNDLMVAAGQGTIAYEIFQDLPDADVILLPIGGGGLAAGASTLAKLLNPDITVIGVEPRGAACMYNSVRNKKVTSLASVETIADGVAVQTPGDRVFPLVQENVDHIVLVDDEDIPNAFLDMLENHKMVVENAGLLTIAALRQIEAQDKKVVAVLSGGNMDIITMSSLVQHGLRNRGRIFSFSVLLPDRPGELLKIAEIIAAYKGNVIKLEHNQFVNINRNAAVELQVTLEAFGHEHKEEILNALNEGGYVPRCCTGTSVY
jgi:threonine dehydratase, medium form